ncbi:DUF2184 domain-containing protein [Beijerinckia sp. L45]|uniref:DUF2184 domain-containing protein n=1 Tax=Beijerinckia sp. L45 TaxID=1641855 RepID=UPI00131BE3DB|nr:DUF2184 domain-containing protein [Beijerinckia sp. L45]
MSFHDRALLGGTALSRPRNRIFTRDAMATYDRATIDSTGVFLIGELERLDPTINAPLVAYTWSRDIDLREDVGIEDEQASFTNSTFAAVGGIQPNGKAWAGKDANAIAGLALDIGKTPQPLHLWAMELGWTLPELASAMRTGRPIETDKTEGMNLKNQMDIDEQVYVGDTLLGIPGLINSPLVNATNVTGGTWAAKIASGPTGPTGILADVNALINSAWAASGYKQAPTDLRLPPMQFGLLAAQIVSSAGSVSILQFLRINSISLSINGRELNIQPLKWLTGAGAGGADRMFAYTNDKKYLRFPLVPLQKTPLEYRSLYQMTTYYGRLGQVEFRYPETLAYADGI